jgi:hypothetical protein
MSDHERREEKRYGDGDARPYERRRIIDKTSWVLMREFVAPIVAALLMGAVIWGSVKEKINNLEKVNAGDRIVALEVSQNDIKTDVVDIKKDVKEILRRVR